jgi:hypothetical protein
LQIKRYFKPAKAWRTGRAQEYFASRRRRLGGACSGRSQNPAQQSWLGARRQCKQYGKAGQPRQEDSQGRLSRT